MSFVKKAFLLLFAIFALGILHGEAKTLQGAVTYTDPNFTSNIKALAAGQTQVDGRYIYDYGFAYGVVNAEFTQGFYFYKKSGQCYAYDLYKGEQFPKQLEQYTYPSGKLTHRGIVFSPLSGTLYDLQGKMVNTWNGTQCNQPNGRSCGTRTYSHLD